MPMSPLAIVKGKGLPSISTFPKREAPAPSPFGGATVITEQSVSSDTLSNAMTSPAGSSRPEARITSERSAQSAEAPAPLKPSHSFNIGRAMSDQGMSRRRSSGKKMSTDELQASLTARLEILRSSKVFDPDSSPMASPSGNQKPAVLSSSGNNSLNNSTHFFTLDIL